MEHGALRPPARPFAATHAARRGIAGALLVLAVCACGCAALDTPAAGAPPVRAPAWENVAFPADGADFVGAIDLAGLRADPLFGPVLTQLARKEHLGLLTRASQIDAVASIDGGKATGWLVVVHGVHGPPGEGDVGSNPGEVVTAPGAWVFGEGPAFERVRAAPGLAGARVVLPDRALVASTAQGRAFPHLRHAELGDLTDGLGEATAVLLGGAHLEVILRCRYVDATAARRAATAARVALVAAAARTDAVAALARELVQLDFDATGDTVSVRLTLSDDLRDLLVRYVERATR
ncbi:MAG TPA: hypothetical protein VHS09_01825 [Polyangiaceae bacterium]|jgi:hypothetical protein|nr:hypothetical protein [Polyangiaceae bacterium]